MQEWCLQHPWMTFFLAFFCIETASVILQKAIDARRRPTKTAVFQGIISKPKNSRDDDLRPPADRKSLN